MDEMLKKQDVLDAIYATMEKTDKPDVILGLAAAMSTVKQMQAVPANPAEKQEPCKDAISRQAAIYVINHAEVNFSVESEIDFTKHKREVHEIIENVLGAQEKALKELPPVTPQPNKWIPVSERLPEVGSEVLVCYDFKGKRSVYIADFYGDGNFHGLDDEYLTTEGRKYRKAVAWMPLPEPYKASPTGKEDD